MEYYLKEQLTEDEIYKMVQEADTLNADAQIDKEEFLAIMMGFWSVCKLRRLFIFIFNNIQYFHHQKNN